MRSVFILPIYFILSIFTSHCQANQPIKMDVTMKSIAFEYKNAITANNTKDFLSYLKNIEVGLKQIETMTFKQKNEKSHAGIKQVKKVVLSSRAFANNGDLLAAKKALKEIDSLRKQYHKIHEPSFWQIMFG